MLCSAQERKRQQNHEAYLRRKPLPTVPPDISVLAAEPISSEDYKETYLRFAHGDDTIGFDTYDICLEDLDIFAGPPPYPVVPQMSDDWECISAVIHGFLAAKYDAYLALSLQECRQLTLAQKSSRARYRYEGLLDDFRKLSTSVSHRETGEAQSSDNISRRVASQNLRWKAKQVCDAADDICTLRDSGTPGLIVALNERRWKLLRR